LLHSGWPLNTGKNKKERNTEDYYRVAIEPWGRFLKGGINYTRYNSYSRDKSAILGITIPGIKMGSRKH